MPERRKTRQISVGNDRTGRVLIGGDAEVAVQTMTSGYTYEIDECVAEINRMADAGADIVRVAVLCTRSVRRWRGVFCRPRILL